MIYFLILFWSTSNLYSVYLQSAELNVWSWKQVLFMLKKWMGNTFIIYWWFTTQWKAQNSAESLTHHEIRLPVTKETPSSLYSLYEHAHRLRYIHTIN